MGSIRFSIDERLLHFFKEYLPLEIFVETGTFKGDTLEIVEKYFPACFSIEKSHVHQANVTARFKGKEHIFIEKGDSADHLENIKEHIGETPTMIWLDAHDCNNTITPDVDGLKSQSPILRELAALETLHEQSVLIIDDARLYMNVVPKPNNFRAWPDLHDVIMALLPMSEHHRLTVYDDTLVFYPNKLKDEFTQFAYDHSIDVLSAMLDARSYRENLAMGHSPDKSDGDGSSGGGGGWLGKLIKK